MEPYPAETDPQIIEADIQVHAHADHFDFGLAFFVFRRHLLGKRDQTQIILPFSISKTVRPVYRASRCWGSPNG